MKIKFTRSFDSPRYGRIKAGDQKDIPAADAKAFIRDNRAEAVKSSRTQDKEIDDVS